MFYEYHQIWLSDVTSHPMPTKNWWQVCRLDYYEIYEKSRFFICCHLIIHRQVPIPSLIISCLKLKLNVIILLSSIRQDFSHVQSNTKKLLCNYFELWSVCDQARMIKSRLSNNKWLNWEMKNKGKFTIIVTACSYSYFWLFFISYCNAVYWTNEGSYAATYYYYIFQMY